MGAIVSMPLQMAGTWAASCCGSMCFSLVSKSFQSIGSSFSTRLSYAFLFFINAIISWIMLTNFMVDKLEKLNKYQCEGIECGFFAVHRLNFALGMLHLLLGGLLIGVHSTTNPRSKIQNSFWAPKLLVWLLFCVGAFFMPESFYVFWSKYISVISGGLFLIIGLILLVDFAHEWAETCIDHVEAEDEYSEVWKTVLISGTGLMYVGSIAMTIVMFIFFAHSGCSMNQAAIITNLILTIIVTGLSLSPVIQEYNPNCGLAQSSMVSVYCTYLTLSACASEPDSNSCNPFIRNKGTRTASVVLGAIFTLITIAYTTTRAAANSAFNGNRGGGAIVINYDEPLAAGDDEERIIDQEPSRNEMRMQAIREAVAVGSLPESALYDQSWLYEEGDQDDEKTATKYNYVLFHIIFFLATQWLSVLLTMNVDTDDFDDFVPVGRTFFYSWVKIVSAWICYAIYAWSLIAPVVLPDRFS